MTKNILFIILLFGLISLSPAFASQANEKSAEAVLENIDAVHAIANHTDKTIIKKKNEELSSLERYLDEEISGYDIKRSVLSESEISW